MRYVVDWDYPTGGGEFPLPARSDEEGIAQVRLLRRRDRMLKDSRCELWRYDEGKPEPDRPVRVWVKGA